jgi:HPt (histidine-containing phosphotransfer) domain-containing protein
LTAPLLKLAGAPGFELLAALQRMGGDPVAFMQALALARPSLRQWHDRHVQQRLPYDAVVAHDLKGVCTMMGAQALAAAAHRLEAQLRRGEDAGAAATEVTQWLEPTLQALEEALAPTDAQATQAPPLLQLQPQPLQARQTGLQR